ncbi:hypothetical protein A6U96_13975 [Agrobacterium tumefaciens]|nr:hypothetical protein A6U96_13975 [Agrobacterium tumefaciens]
MADNKKKKEIVLDKMPWEMSDEELRNAGLIETNTEPKAESNIIDIGNRMPWELSDDELKLISKAPVTNSEPKEETETFEDVDTSIFDDEAGSGVRFEVSGMETVRDKKKVLEKYYDDVRPINGGHNFVMRDRETGKDIVLNKESWVPSLSDFAGTAPDLIGGVTGGVLGALGGSAGGSVVPGFGTVAGGATGGAAGYAGGKNLIQKGINTLYGNEDTRDFGEYAKDVAGDAAVGAVAEIGGRAVGPAIQLGKGVFNKAIASPVKETVDVVKGAPVFAESRYGIPDAGDIVKERLDTFVDAGLSPTAGMVGGKAMATKELQAATQNPAIKATVQDVYDQAENKLTQQIDNLGTGGSQSVAETGQLIKQGVSDFNEKLTARNSQLYNDVGNATTGINASGQSLNKLATSLNDEFTKLPEISKRNFGNVYQSIFDDLGALKGDIANGIGFETIKETRTALGSKLADRGLSSAEKNLYNRYYAALTDEMKDIAAKANDDILAKWTKANNSTKRMYDSTSSTSKNLMNKIINGTDEAAYNLILTGSKKNIGQARQIMNLVKAGAGQSAVGDVQSSILTKIGTKNGAFDVNVFARNFQTLSPEAKKLLGQGDGVTSVPGSLDKLSKAINLLATDYAKHQNFSNTAAHLDAGKRGVLRSIGTKVGMGYISGGMSLVGDAAASAINTVLKMSPNRITDPKFINSLTYIVEAKTPSEIQKRITNAIASTRDEAIKLQLRQFGEHFNSAQQNIK